MMERGGIGSLRGIEVAIGFMPLPNLYILSSYSTKVAEQVYVLSSALDGISPRNHH